MSFLLGLISAIGSFFKWLWLRSALNAGKAEQKQEDEAQDIQTLKAELNASDNSASAAVELRDKTF